MRTLTALPWTALLAALLLMAPPARAEGSEEKPAVIHFADLGGIRDFRALDDQTLLVQGTNKRWFRATLFGTCIGLRTAERIAFITEPGGDLGRFSAIFVEGRRCAFRSFEPSAPPLKPARSEKKS